MGRRLVFCLGYRKSNLMNEQWPEQEVFCLRVKGFAEREGYLTPRKAVDLSRLAERFGIAENSLKQFLQNKNRPRPHFDTLSRIAEIVDVDLSEFMGSEKGPATEFDPGFAKIMGTLGPNIPDDVKKMLIGLAQAHQPKGVTLVDPDEAFSNVKVTLPDLETQGLVIESMDAIRKRQIAEERKRKALAQDGRLAKPEAKPAKKAAARLLAGQGGASAGKKKVKGGK